MSTINENIEKIASHYGLINQIDKTCEESAELISDLIGYKFSATDKHLSKIIEEIADMEIMIDQLKMLLQIDDMAIIAAKSYKTERALTIIRKNEIEE